MEAFDSLPRVPLCGSIWVWPSSARDAAVPSAPVPVIFPWVHTICCSWANPPTASPGEEDAAVITKPGFCSPWVAEQDWLLLLVLRAVLGQQSPSPCPWGMLGYRSMKRGSALGWGGAGAGRISRTGDSMLTRGLSSLPSLSRGACHCLGSATELGGLLLPQSTPLQRARWVNVAVAGQVTGSFWEG